MTAKREDGSEWRSVKANRSRGHGALIKANRTTSRRKSKCTANKQLCVHLQQLITPSGRRRAHLRVLGSKLNPLQQGFKFQAALPLTVSHPALSKACIRARAKIENAVGKRHLKLHPFGVRVEFLERRDHSSLLNAHLTTRGLHRDDSCWPENDSLNLAGTVIR